MAGEHHIREKFAHKAEFILASLGWAVGYGNVWRFPFKCYENGGGVFLIPYFFALLFAGVPMYALELSMGQFSSLGANKVFEHMAPVFSGIGWGCILVSVLVALYFNLLISYSIYYMALSFRFTDLLWSGCNNTWNTLHCYSNLEDARCEESLGKGAVYFQQACYSAADNVALGINATFTALKLGGNLTSPADEFFYREVLRLSDGMDDLGTIQWHLVICQAIAWFIVFLCICGGVTTSGKVVYFTATFPYVLITILLIRGLTLPGAFDGIYYYMVPDFSKLFTLKIWKEAAIQIFYTYGVAFGVIITLASYNNFKSNVLRDAFTICCTDSLTSIYTGFAVFSTAGFIAQVLGKDVGNVVTSGSGLAFVVYAEALSRMPWGQMWSVLFFFMMILIGIDSQFPMIETPATALMDQFPRLRRFKPLLFLGFCFIGFLIGIVMCTNGGYYILTLLNDYSAGYCLMVLSLAEVLVVMYVYGFRKFKANIEQMVGQKPNWVWYYWMACWLVITPLFLIFITYSSLVGYGVSEVRGYVFPPWVEAIGWAMSLGSLLCIPVFALAHLIYNRIKKQPLWALVRPTIDWCPAEERTARHLKGVSQRMGSIVNPVPPPGVASVEAAYNNPAMDKNEEHRF